MNKKTIIAIIIAIIVIAACYGVYRYLYPAIPVSEEEQGEEEKEEPKGEISILLENLEQETGIDFSEEQEIQFIWYTGINGELNEVVIQGKGFEVKGVSSEDHRKVESFFQDKGFEIDVYNITDGTFVGLVGYQKDRIVCTVVGRMWLDEQGIPSEQDKNDVEVRCGEITETSGLANPAAAYCLEMVGELMSVQTPEGIVGYCVLPDGETCAQWELFYSEGDECVSPGE